MKWPCCLPMVFVYHLDSQWWTMYWFHEEVRPVHRLDSWQWSFVQAELKWVLLVVPGLDE